MDFNILREAGVPSLFVVGVVVAVSLMKLFHATRAYARQGRKECLEL